MRQYDIVFDNADGGSFSIIAKDYYDTNWFVYERGLSENTARLVLAGLEAQRA